MDSKYNWSEKNFYLKKHNKMQQQGICAKKHTEYLKLADKEMLMKPHKICTKRFIFDDGSFIALQKNGFCPKSKSFYKKVATKLGIQTRAVASTKQKVQPTLSNQRKGPVSAQDKKCTDDLMKTNTNFGYWQQRCPKGVQYYMSIASSEQLQKNKELCANMLFSRSIQLFNNYRKAGICSKSVSYYIGADAAKDLTALTSYSYKDKECAKAAKSLTNMAYWKNYRSGLGCNRLFEHYKALSVKIKKHEDNLKLAKKNSKLQGELDKQGKYAGMLEDKAFTQFQKDVGMTFIDIKGRKKHKNWDQALKHCLANKQLLPSFDDLKKHKDLILQYSQYKIVEALKKSGRKMTKSNIRYNKGKANTISPLYVSKKSYSTGKGGVAFIGKDKQYVSFGNYGLDYMACKNATSQEIVAYKDKTKRQAQLVKKMRKKYHAKNGLAYWQMLIENKNNLKEFYKYVNGISLSVGEVFAKFNYGKSNSGGMIFQTEFEHFKQSQRYEVSQNIFKWALKTNTGERSSYLKRASGKTISSTLGLTRSGLNKLIKDIKSSTLIRSLDNVNVVDYGNNISIIGSFKDKQGQKHNVTLEIHSTFSFMYVR